MRVSRCAWEFFASWYSAFSFRSPHSRAVVIRSASSRRLSVSKRSTSACKAWKLSAVIATLSAIVSLWVVSTGWMTIAAGTGGPPVKPSRAGHPDRVMTSGAGRPRLVRDDDRRIRRATGRGEYPCAVRACDGSRGPHCRVRHARRLGSPRHGRSGLVHRLAPGARLPDRTERGELAGQYEPRLGPPLRIRPADGGERRDDRQLLLSHRPHGRSPGLRRHRPVRRRARSRRLRDPPRPLVPLPDRVLAAAGAARRRNRADLRPYTRRV